MAEASVADGFRSAASALNDANRQYWEDQLSLAVEGLRQNAGDESSLAAASYCLKKLRRHREALALLKARVDAHSPPALHRRLIHLMEECNLTEDAIAQARLGWQLYPSDLLFRIKEVLLLPVFYDSSAELQRYRLRFQTGLRQLTDEVLLDTTEHRAQALAAIGHHTNTFLGYQGQNDRELQTLYGNLVHRIMAASYPDLTRELPKPCRLRSAPMRVGYVSSRFLDVSATRFFLGWLSGHDPERVRVYTWQLGSKCDAVTDEVRRISHEFHQSCGTAGEIGEKIRGQSLDAVVFLDLGMDPVITQLAALRLAPLQCMAWDHPVTSGLPTIDYALTSELAEPEDGETQYSEKLLRLPGVGVCYRRPAIPRLLLAKTRSDFLLRAESIVYLCCQSAFKLLPENDRLLTQIAARVPNSQFVFIAANECIAADLRTRLSRSFADAGLDAAALCVVLPQLSHLDYWNLHLLAEVFLDTPLWSSGGSVFEAVACRIPVVTLPGSSMRSRQGMAILSQMGVHETIAEDADDYVRLAVQLGVDRSLRKEVVERMVAGYSRLYSDMRSIAVLENFFALHTFGAA